MPYPEVPANANVSVMERNPALDQEALRNNIFKSLVAAGYPEQTAHNIATVSARASNISTAVNGQPSPYGMRNSMAGLTSLSPSELAAINMFETNPELARSLGMDQMLGGLSNDMRKLVEHGYQTGNSFDLDVPYENALQARASAIRNKYIQEGNYLSHEDAIQIATSQMGTKEEFQNRRAISQAYDPERINDQATEFGTNVGIGALLGGASSAMPVPQRGILPPGFGDDIRRSNPFSIGATEQGTIAAEQAFRQAVAAGHPEQINKARQAYMEAAQAEGFAPGKVIGNLNKILPAGFGAYSALTNNIRGQSAGQNLQYLLGTGANQPTADDYINFATGAGANTLANVAMFESIPRAARGAFGEMATGGAGGLSNGLKSLGRSATGGFALMNAAELAPNLALSAFGSDWARRNVNQRQLAIAQKMRDDGRTGQGLSDYSIYGPNGTFDPSKGIFYRMGAGYEPDAGVLDNMLTTLGDVGHTAGELALAPASLVSTGIGALTRAGQAVGNVGVRGIANATGNEGLRQWGYDNLDERGGNFQDWGAQVRAWGNPAHWNKALASAYDTYNNATGGSLSNQIEEYDRANPAQVNPENDQKRNPGIAKPIEYSKDVADQVKVTGKPIGSR